MEPTNYQLYCGRIGSLTSPKTNATYPNAFADLGLFVWETGKQIQYNIEAFTDTNAFDNWFENIPSLSTPYLIREDYESYVNENQSQLDLIKTKIFQICGVNSNDFDLTYLFVSTRQKILVAKFSHLTNKQNLEINFYAETYDSIMANQQNVELGFNAITLAWSYSDTADGKYSQMQSAN